jgi:hypothetical protein
MSTLTVPVLDRLMARVTVDENGCWLYTGVIQHHGYGRIGAAGRMVYTHRVTFEHHVGPIPEGLQLDHRCRVRACCNPAHLEAVTCQENLRRGATLNAANAAKTHCLNGHPFDEANTYVDPKGHRVCRACRRARWRARQRDAAHQHSP